MAYLVAVYGDTAGMAHLACGAGQHIDANGRFKHRAFTQSVFSWPNERDQLVRAVLQEVAGGADVYACPYLMTDRKRAKGAAVERRLVHADVDTLVSIEKVKALGGF